VSGPVETCRAASEAVDGPVVVLEPSREAVVGTTTVRRALPRRRQRTVGAWCFADHLGPLPGGGLGSGIGPHPHIGLQTVTWLVEGETLHRDSLGHEQLIRPGQLNLMTAGRGIAHAEEGTAADVGPHHGIQLWVAQPEGTRHDDPAFEHHAELPRVAVDSGEAAVLVGEFGGVRSPARADTDHVGVDLALRRGSTVLPLELGYEYALIVLDGAVDLGEDVVAPGVLAYLGCGRDELAMAMGDDARVMLLGGTPFESEILMWWNFVARTREEMADARTAWQDHDEERFGPVTSALDWIAAPGLPWS
jgi:hypothetical protein